MPFIEKPQSPIFYKVHSTVTIHIFLKINPVTVLRTLNRSHYVFYKRCQSSVLRTYYNYFDELFCHNTEGCKCTHFPHDFDKVPTLKIETFFL